MNGFLYECKLVLLVFYFNYIRCFCNYLILFGFDFFVFLNIINFMIVFNDFEVKLRDNWVVFVVFCFMYLMYMIGLIWVCFKDKRDVIKVCM